ncbi:MAG: hypothetical protein WAT20_10880 [Ferruginibacter sp.]
MKKLIKIYLIAAIISLVSPIVLCAQTDQNNNQPFQQDPPADPNGPPPPNDAPIDGGLSLLLAAGAAYGVKKYRDGRREAGGRRREAGVRS